MYYIKQSEWNELAKNHPDYCGKSIHDSSVRVIFEGIIPGNNGKGGTTLLFEHKHFEVVPDGKFNGRTDNPDEEDAAEALWTAACTGNLEDLEKYYNIVGEPNKRYYKLGHYNSLIAAAARNGNYDAVRYLLQRGERPTAVEKPELRSFYLDELYHSAESLVSYFQYHNKNLTNAQDSQVENLREIVSTLAAFQGL